MRRRDRAGEGPLRRGFLRGYQVEPMRYLADAVQTVRGKTFTVMFPRQAGKNEVSGALVACLLLANVARGGTVVICAPTLTPQGRISTERTLAALDALRPGGLAVRTNESGNVVRVGKARAVFLSASPAAHVAGHTASIALIGDEAQDIDADWFNRQFRPMAASTGASTVLFGTAWNGNTLLEVAARSNGRRKVRGFPLHWEVAWETVAESIPVYGDYVREERQRLGAEHPLFVTQYELRSTTFAKGMFSREQLESLRGRHEQLDGPRQGERYVAGLDFGGEGRDADRTVLTIARVAGERARCEVVAFREWQGAPFGTLWEELESETARWGLERICADGTGLGAPLIAGLRDRMAVSGQMLRTPEIESLTFTSQVKSELGFALMAALNGHALSVFAGEDAARSRCLQEFAECQSELAGGQTMRWGNDHGHDDYPVSVALALRAAQSAGRPRMALGRRGR